MDHRACPIFGYMKINLRSFGIAKDIIGKSNTSMDIPQGSTIAQVKNELVDTYPKFKALAKFAIAVNEAYESDEN